MTDNNQNIIDEDRLKEEMNDQSQDTRKMADDDCDSLLVKQKVYNQQAKRRLSISAFVAVCIVLLLLLTLLGWRFGEIKDILDVYKIHGKSDVLWFYGFSMFSLLMTILSLVIGLINIFTFRKKKEPKQEVKYPLDDAYSKFVELLQILKNDKK